MSFFNWAVRARAGSGLNGIWGRLFANKRKRRSQRRFRSLQMDPLESRCLLSVSPVNLSAILVNQTFGAQQITSTARSIAADNNGDFVVVWTRSDNVVNSAGVPVIDPSTGNQMTVANVYARYFTDEVQQVSLPGPGSFNANGTSLPNGIASNFDNDPNTIGFFSLTYNAQTVLKLSVTAGVSPSGNPDAPTNANIAGQFTLWFDANADGKITANEVTTINFDEINPALNAKAIQTWLNTFGPTTVNGKVVSDGSHAVVAPVDPQHYLIDFGAATQGLDQSLLLQYLRPTDPRVPVALGTPAFNLSGFLPAVSVTVEDRPFTANNIPVSQTDPNQTARAIENYFQTRVASYTSGAAPFTFPIAANVAANSWAPYPSPIATPVGSTPGVTTANAPQTGFNPSITAVPVTLADGSLSYTDFNITFTGQSGKQIEPKLVVGNCVDENGVAIDSSFSAVNILKQSSAEFKVNPNQSISNIYQPITSVLAADQPTVAMDAAGDFVIAWRSQVLPSLAPKDVTNIFFRHFSPTGIVDSYNPNTFVPGQTLDGSGQVTDAAGNAITQVRMIANPQAIDVQQITFNAANGATLPVTGLFALSMAGVTTQAITFNGGDPNATAANIATALANIRKPATVVAVPPSIQPGKPGVYVFKVTFDGSSKGIDEPPLQYTPVVDSGGNALPVNFAQTGLTSDMYTAQANVNYTNPQYQPAVAMDTQGNFNIVWANQGQDLSYFNDISMQRFDRDGNRLGNPVVVNTPTTSQELNPAIAIGADDNCVVTWTQTNDPNYLINGIGTGTLYVRGFDSTGTPLWNDANIGFGPGSTVSMDGRDNFVVTWTANADADQNGRVSRGVFGIEGALLDALGKPLKALQIIRPQFRLNSAATAADSPTVWPYDQFNSQAVMDLDGDLAATYQGYGPAVSENINIPATFFRPYFKLNTDTTTTGSQNQDLLAYFNPFPHNGSTGDTLGANGAGANSLLYQFDNFGVQTSIDQVLFNAKYNPPNGGTAATDEQLGRLRAILEGVAGKLRGDSYGVMTSMYNAAPQFVVGPNSSDDIVNTQRTGNNQRYYIVFNPDAETGDPAAGGVGFQLQITVLPSTVNNTDIPVDIQSFQTTVSVIVPEQGGQGGPIDAGAVQSNIAAAINNALGQMWPGNKGINLSVNVRQLTSGLIGTVEYDARTGTYWDFPAGMPTDQEVDNPPTVTPSSAATHPYVIYELTFQGAAHDIPISLAVTGSAMQHWVIQPGQQGAQTFVLVGASAPVAIEGDYRGVQSSPSYNASVAMTSAGDLVYAYTHQFLQTDGATPLNADGNPVQQNIYVQQVNESTNTAGPQIVDWSDGTTDNKHFLNGGTISGVANGLQYFVITFDQPMLAGDPTLNPDSVLNLANYLLIDSDGNVVSNAVSHIDYGLSEVALMSSSYGLNPVPSNKFEAILTLDGDPNQPGNQGLTAGTYTLQVNQAIPASSTSVGQAGLRNIYGNPLSLSGYNPNGLTFSRTVTLGAASPAGAPGLVAQDEPINAQRGGQQIDPSTASALDGSYVVVWTSILNGQADIVGQRFDFNNIPLGSEFTINTTISTTWGHADVAMDPAGDFVVTWSGGGPNVSATTNPSDVYARRFNALGQAIGSQFLVNQYLPSVQSNPRVAMSNDGTFVITWQSYGQGSVANATTVNYAIYAREYAFNGTPVHNSTFQPNGNEFLVSSPSTYARTTPDVAMDANNDFVIVWAGDFQQQSTWGVYGNYFYGGTGKSTGEVLLNKTPAQRGSFTTPSNFDLYNTGPRIGMAANTGNFVVTWANYTGTSPGYNIFARQFAPGCVPLGGTPSAAGEFQVNRTPAQLQPTMNPPTIGWQLMPAVGVDTGGNFTVAWTGYGQDNAEVNNPAILDYGIYARMYFANGTDYFDTNLGTFPLEYRVNATTLGNQVAPAVARGNAAGDSVITWIGPDTLAAGTTAVYVRVVDPPTAAPAGRNATVAPLPSITVADKSVSVGAAANQLTFTVGLSAASTKPVTFAYATADGTAKAGVNYTAKSGNITFAAGQTSKTVTVNVAGMTAAGLANKTLQLNLKNPINAKLARYAATGTIVDSLPVAVALPAVNIADVSSSVGTAGGAAVFTVTLSKASTAVVAVAYSTADGTAKAGTNYTAISGALSFAPGQVSKTIIVPLAAIKTAGLANSTFQLKLAAPIGATIARSAATGTIVDALVAAVVAPSITAADVTLSLGATTGTVTFTVNLSAATTNTVTVKYGTADGAAKAASGAYRATAGTLSFAPGQTSKTITVPVAGFTAAGMANRTFLLNLTNAVNGKIARATATATVVDILKALPSLAIGSASIARPATGTAYATFVVTLSASSAQTVTVNYLTANGTALAGVDYTAQSGKLTFAPGVTSLKITVPILASGTRKGTYAFNVLLSSPANASLVGSAGVGTIMRSTTTASTSASTASARAASLIGLRAFRAS